MIIINSGSKLNTRIRNVMKKYQSVGAEVHEVVVSALWHAAKYGQPDPLNAIVEGLRPNDQQAVKLFIRRSFAMNASDEFQNPDGLDGETVQRLVTEGQILSFEKGKYLVTQGHTSEVSVRYAKLCEDRLIQPDGKDVKMVLDGNNVVETQLLGDADILKKVTELKNAINSGERKVVTINDKTKQFILKISGEAEALAQQYREAK